MNNGYIHDNGLEEANNKEIVALVKEAMKSGINKEDFKKFIAAKKLKKKKL
ncbi:DNA-binding anti-repressor SinI [Metabacillus sp. Hm71]|uniref:DNA-binding anti-repressor SinI n=1 Tax=Metabacillus sp. Hm71 TaxID=3450743 RepID=UPI003F43EED7